MHVKIKIRICLSHSEKFIVLNLIRKLGLNNANYVGYIAATIAQSSSILGIRLLALEYITDNSPH